MAGPGAAGPFVFGQNANRETLSGNKTLTKNDEQVQSLDPAGARDVTLPAEEGGLVFLIVNRSDGAEDITLKDDGGTTLATISEDEAALCVCDGTGWAVLLSATATVQT